MELLKGGSIHLIAYFEDTNNDPVTGQNANITFSYRYTDNSGGGGALASTHELGGGWYAYLYTDTTGLDFVWWANYTGGKDFAGGSVEIRYIASTDDTHSHTNNTDKQTVFEETISSGIKIFHGIRLDMVNITQNTTVRVEEKIDGDNYRVVDEVVWDIGMTRGLPIHGFMADSDIKITIQSGALEGSARNVPYRYRLEVL